MNIIEQEIALLRNHYPDLETDIAVTYLRIPAWPLGPGWNQRSTTILILIPPGYPITPPDSFYADATLRLESNSFPGNTASDHQQLGQGWIWFSYHLDVADWQPTSDPSQGSNLLMFLAGVDRRLREAS